MNLMERSRWQIALGASLLINFLVFEWAATMSRISPTARTEYVSVELSTSEITAAPTAAPPMARPKKIVEPKKPEPRIEEKAPEPLAIPAPDQPPPPEEFHGAEGSGEETVPQAQQDAPATRPISDFQPISRLSKMPRPKSSIAPTYPDAERAAGFEATVIVEVYINEAGAVVDAHVVKSGGTSFDNAALNAIKAVEFEPGYVRDKPSPVKVRIPFVFKLH
jgi:TonB family protein